MKKEYLKVKTYGDKLTGRTEIIPVFPLLTLRQLFALLILAREPNYIYSTWKEIVEEDVDLNICLSATRAIFNKFKKSGIIREMLLEPYKPTRGPKRKMHTITPKGLLIARAYYKSIQNIVSRKAQ